MDINVMSWLSWIVIGGLVGCAASIVVKNHQNLATNIIVGTVGAFIGGYLLNMTGQPGDFNIASLVGAFFGAMVLLSVSRLLVGTYRAAY